MSKTILLGVATQHSRKAPRIAHTLMGLYFLVYGGFYLVETAYTTGELIFRGSMIIIGLAYILYAQFAFSSKSKFAPRISIDENVILCKTSFFRKGYQIKWIDIKSIEFNPYQVDFVLENKTENLTYDTNADVSIDIKEALREVAEAKNIEIIGG